jgi:hypothetical protein
VARASACDPQVPPAGDMRRLSDRGAQPQPAQSPSGCVWVASSEANAGCDPALREEAARMGTGSASPSAPRPGPGALRDAVPVPVPPGAVHPSPVTQIRGAAATCQATTGVPQGHPWRGDRRMRSCATGGSRLPAQGHPICDFAPTQPSNRWHRFANLCGTWPSRPSRRPPPCGRHVPVTSEEQGEAPLTPPTQTPSARTPPSGPASPVGWGGSCRRRSRTRLRPPRSTAPVGRPRSPSPRR